MYSIKPNGLLLYERGFYVVPGRTQWNVGTITNDFQYQATASGPAKAEDLPATLYAMKQNNIKPFLVVRLMDDTHTKYCKYVWSDYDTGGDDWYAYMLNATIINATTNTTDYICVGDTFASNVNQLAGQAFLFAHRSIVRSVAASTRQTWEHNEQTVQFGDVGKGTSDEMYLYTNLGYDVTGQGTAPVVLRCFLDYKKSASVVNTILTDNWDITFNTNVLTTQVQFRNGISLNDTESQYYVMHTVDAALKNLADCILLGGTEINMTFQGFYIAETKLLNAERARRLMVELCNSDLPDPIVAEYPNICACLGRKGAEQALRTRLNNNLIRMVCQSSVCLDGDRTGGVYRFQPNPPCSPINICQQGIDIEAERVNMQNVNFSCTFDSAGLGVPLVLPAVAPVIIPGIPPPAPVPPVVIPGLPDANSDMGKIIGGVVGGIIFVVLIAVAVVLIRRRLRRSAPPDDDDE